MNILFYPHLKYRAQFFLRYIWPAKQLMKHGFDVRIKDPRTHGEWTLDKMAEDFSWADLVVAFYPKTRSGISLVEIAHDMNKKIVVDVDDYSFAVHPSNPAYGFSGTVDVEGIWHDGIQYSKLTAMENHSRWAHVMGEADALTVTQKYLGDMYAPFCGHHKIWVLPNSLDLSYYKKWKRRAPSDEVRIGWQGGASHHMDLKILNEPIEEIRKKHKNVKFVLFGAHWPGQKVDFPEVDIHPWVDSDTFYTKLGSLDFDIGLCPVEDSIFSKGKSNLKVLEYGVHGVPSVCSTFEDSPYNGPPGKDINWTDRVLVENKPEFWFEAIDQLVADEKLRKDIGNNARITVEEVYNIERTWEHWGDCYEQVHKGILAETV